MLTLLVSLITYFSTIKRIDIGYNYLPACQESELSVGYDFDFIKVGGCYTFDYFKFPHTYTRVNELGYLYYQVPIKNFYLYNSIGIGSTWDIEILFGYKYKIFELRTGVSKLDKLVLELRINLLD